MIGKRFVLLVTSLLLGVMSDGLTLARAADTNGAYAPMVRPAARAADIVLIYHGAKDRPVWDASRLASYVSWQDPQSGRERWLFDGFLFLELWDGQGYEFEPGRKMKPSGQAQWAWLLDRFFARGQGIPALEKACQAAAARAGQPVRRRQVYIAIPGVPPAHTNWGTIQGRALDFASVEDRVAAVDWYLEAALERWRKLRPAHLDLGGFYWLTEGTGPQHAPVLPRVAELVRRQGKVFLWIPYWNAAGASQWRSFGFDAAYQQPNHFFHPEVPDSRLAECCAVARRHGMGLEMEFDGRMISESNVFAPRFAAYLDAYAAAGVEAGAAMAYYEGGGALAKLARSQVPAERGHYERLARWVAGRQERVDRP